MLSTNFCDIFSGVGYLTSNKPFSFGAD